MVTVSTMVDTHDDKPIRSAPHEPPSEVGLRRWHAVVAARDTAALPGLMAPDAEFHSPALFRPQVGARNVAAYLTCALAVFGETFHYVDQWQHDDAAILEFRATVDGLALEGIDRITWDAAGQITSFTVMVRPLRALHALVERMSAELSAIGQSS